MKQSSARLRALAATTSLLGLFGIAAMGGCSDVAGIVEGCDSDFTAEAQWGANLDIDYRVKSFMGASGALVTLSSAMVKDVTDACVGIATATKRDAAKWESLEGADRLTAACAEAEVGMDDVIKANAMVTIGLLIEGGGCQASLSATADCNAKCDVTGGCTPAQLEAKCEPGKLAGSCTAQCTGSCTAKAGAQVACNGTCGATCNGDCAGTCAVKDANGKCAGRCDGTCNGTCSGRCDYQAGASASCDGTCSGECSVEFQAPYCEGKLTPPECMLDADCEASCRAQVQAEAVCTPPTVKIEVNGGASADFMALVTALETHLPKLIQNIGVRGEATLDAADTLVTVGQNLDDAITSSGKAFICTTLAAKAAVSASVEVKVSVEASASIGGKAGAATN
jgi:hypothetical protein